MIVVGGAPGPRLGVALEDRFDALKQQHRLWGYAPFGKLLKTAINGTCESMN